MPLPPGRRTLLLTAAALGVAAALILSGWPYLRRSLQERRQREMLESGTMMQERRIYNACLAFGSVRGRLPGTLDDLVPDFLPDRNSLTDPDHPAAGEIGYRYYASGRTGAEPSPAVFLASKALVRGRELVIRFDGTSDLVPPLLPKPISP